MLLRDLIDVSLLAQMLEERYVSVQTHPTEPLDILNYTQRTQFDRVWNPVTRQCRGLIYNYETGEVVARPWPKFFNVGEYEEGLLDLNAPVVVTDKWDGSLGILYPTSDGYAVATRGSFTSDQALHATEVLRSRYIHPSGLTDAGWYPSPGLTYLYEIVYPANRIVVDYRELDDLILLGVLDTETGEACSPRFWPGLRAAEFRYRTLAEALEAELRPNAEGLVVHFLDGPCAGERVKLKQEDYIVLHRILTGTNARNVWEVAAVRACADYIAEPKHWGTYLGMDPARAAECLVLGDDWLEAVPDEFHEWVRETTRLAEATAADLYAAALDYAEQVSAITERAARYAAVRQHPLVTEIMRVASAEGFEKAHLKYVREYAKIARDVVATLRLQDFDVPLETCVQRDLLRAVGEGHVGREVIVRMHERWQNAKRHGLADLEREVPEDDGYIYVPNTALPPAWIFDIDGTLALNQSGRSPFDWGRVSEDACNEPVRQLVWALRREIQSIGGSTAYPAADIVVLSGRDAACRLETANWLRANLIPHQSLLMRPQGDTRKDSIVKLELFRELVAPNFCVLGVVDDRQQVVDMWRRIGLFCAQVAAGDF